MVCASVALNDEKLIVLVLDVGRINAETIENRSLNKLLNLVAPLRQRHKQRRQHKQPDHVKHERFAGEPVDDEHDRPDDEQHESDDAKQLVQLRALLQERRKETFK